MRKILLHSATIDRHGKWRDAGSELTVGAEGNTDTDLTTSRADELINSQRAVTMAVAAEIEKAESVETAPPPSAPARSSK